MKRDDLPTPDPAPVHAPHPPLADYYPSAEDREAYVNRIFDNTARITTASSRCWRWGLVPVIGARHSFVVA